MDKKKLIVGSAGLALVAGFFLPWIDAGGPFRLSGFDALRATHGWSIPELMMIAVPLFGLAMMASVFASVRAMRLTSLAAGVSLVGYGVYKVVDTFLRVTGWGLWLVIAAALVALAAPLFLRAKR
jgi:hypothetical protein